MSGKSYDIAILGGGLSGCLIALALNRHRPDVTVRIFESGPALGGNHVWSFFDTDIAPEHRDLIEPLITESWQDYNVHFPEHSRTLHAVYNSITSEQLDSVVQKVLPDQSIVTNAQVASASATSVTLASGETIEAGGVIDTRGSGDLGTLSCGWQKFMGQMLHLSRPHGLDRPIVMDATVEQIDGYRFVYCLPFGPDKVFVEDTYYSDTSDLDTQTISGRISEYAAARGWDIVKTDRTETGVLPVVTGGDFEAYWNSTDGTIAKAGARAGLYHPLTSYSLPDAVRFAHYIAAQSDISGEALAKLSHDYSAQSWSDAGYYRMLTKMLFYGAETENRYVILQRFYTLPEKLIRRFYAGESGLYDKLRVLVGKPPIPISRGISALFKK